jgi:tetratricopeptide (TPR) repeat protein
MTLDPSNRRKYVRHRTPKGLWVGWKTAGQASVSRVEDMGLGGIYLHAADPPSKGSIVELAFDLPSGQVRAQAIVRRSTPGKGMGVQFVKMRPEDRAKVNQYLSRQDVAQGAPAAAQAQQSESAPPHSESSQLALSPRSGEAAKLRFERDLCALIELTGKGSYYQLLGVTSESTSSQVKKSYYALARRFHPDALADDREFMAQIKNLMPIITEAYKTLANEENRAAYDKHLAAAGGFNMHRDKTATETSVDEWIERANQCLRAKNFAGSVVWLRKCVESSPSHALYRAMLARSLATIPQYHHEAVEHFQKAIDLDPWRESVYVQFAELLETMSLPRRASAVYSKLLEINPENVDASQRLAILGSGEKDDKHPTLVSRILGRKG